MELERILTNEYLSFEQGFFDGKIDAILQFTGDDDESEFDEKYDDDLDEIDCDPIWYNMGYELAKNYYFQQCIRGIDVDSLILDGEEVVDEFFTEKVIEHNLLEDTKLSVGVFKVRR